MDVGSEAFVYVARRGCRRRRACGKVVVLRCTYVVVLRCTSPPAPVLGTAVIMATVGHALEGLVSGPCRQQAVCRR